MTPEVFYRGMLLALRTRRQHFYTGLDYHAAYRATLEWAAANEPTVRSLATRMLEDFDPVFGTLSAAEAMLLDGMRDLLVVFEAPLYTKAVLKPSVAQAELELRELGDEALFRRLARKLDEELYVARRADAHLRRGTG